MTKWFVIHDMESYEQHRNWIGTTRIKNVGGKVISPIKSFNEIKKGDKVIYYAKGDKVIIGIFRVVSGMEYIRNDPEWGNVLIYRIKDLVVPAQPKDFVSIAYELSFFHNKDNYGQFLRGKTAIRMPTNDYEKIKKHLSSDSDDEETEEMIAEPRKIEAILGKPNPVGNLLYEPVNEKGVIFLFSKFHKDLGFPFILRIKAGFPDAEALDESGKTKTIEFEYRSLNFKTHKHPVDKIDYIICWKHDWKDCPKNKLIILSEVLAGKQFT